MSKGCTQNICCYGASDSGKTHQVGQLAEFVMEKHGKITRLACADPARWGTIEDLVVGGMVVPTYLEFRPNLFAALSKLTKGYWPEHEDDPQSPLLPPEKQKGFKDVGAIAYDSMSQMASLLMRYGIEQEAAGKMRVSGEPVVAVIKEEGEVFGAPSRGSYGSTQNNIARFVAQSSGLDGLYVMWTAHETRGSDEELQTKAPLYGPEIVGQAKTSECPRWFTQVWHIVNDNGKRKMYTTTHLDEKTKFPWKAKTTVPFRYPLPAILDGERCSVKVALELTEESIKKSLEEVKRKMEKKGATI